MSEKYAMFVGEAVKTVSVFKRKNGREYPIYANTRGQTEWYTHEIGEHENVTESTLSGELKAWLAEYHARITGEGETHPNRELPEVEWYEREFLNAIGNPCVIPEVFELMEWAFNEVRA